MGEPYRVPAPGPPDPYLVAWARLKRRRNLTRLGAFVLFVILAPTAMLAWVPPDTRIIGLALGLLLALPVGLFVISLLEPLCCPACHRPFFPSTLAEAGTAQRCAHCGIEMGTPERKGTRWPEATDVDTRARSRANRALAWLVATGLVAWATYAVVRDRPRLAVWLITLGVAVGVMAVVARFIRSRTFPPELLMPASALILASFLAAQINRAEPARSGPLTVDGRPCPTVGRR